MSEQKNVNFGKTRRVFKTQVNEIQCKSILTRSGLPESQYSINPYLGCQIGCIYCYAVFMKRWSHHNEPWGFFIDVKVNAPEVLRKEIKSSIPGVTLLSSVTDPYQPLERKYLLTRRILEILLENDWPTAILTKSSLVTRDQDLFMRFSNVNVGMTISGLREEVRKIFEPLSSPYADRVNALKQMHDNGIKTYVFIGPILPFFTDPVEVYRQVRGKVDDIMIETLNWKSTLQPSILDGYKAYSPDYYKKMIQTIQEKGITYTEWVNSQIDIIRQDADVRVKLFSH